MKINKKKIFFVILLILIIAISLTVFLVNKNKSVENNNESLIENTINENTINENTINENIISENTTDEDTVIDNNFSSIDKNISENEEKSNVEEIKNATGAEGNSNIYEVQTEVDGRKVLAVKNSVRFKTAFAGMIKRDIPKKEELDEIFNKYYPSKNGIWIENNSRNKVLNLLNNSLNKYSIDNDGYLKIEDKSSQNGADKKIEKAINGNKTIIIGVSSICYIVDDKTGNILDYNFGEIDKYQTYEYFEDNSSLIVFINENKDGQLTKNEIIDSMVELF